MTDVAPILGFPDLSSAVLNLCFILSRVVLLTTLSMASSERGLLRKSATCTTARLRSCMMGEVEIYEGHSVNSEIRCVSAIAYLLADSWCCLYKAPAFISHNTKETIS